MENNKLDLSVKIIVFLIAILLVLNSAGCFLFKEKSPDEIKGLKEKVEQYTTSVKKVSEDNRALFEGLKKPNYTTLDINSYLQTTNSLITNLNKYDSDLTMAQAYLQKIKAGSTKYNQFVETKSSEIDVTKRLITKDRSILLKLQKFLNPMPALFKSIEEVKQEQGKEVQIYSMASARIKERLDSQAILTVLLFAKALGSPTSSSLDPGSSVTPSPDSSASSSKTASVSSTSATSSTTDSTPDWVYQNLNYDNQSRYIVDFLGSQTDKLTNLYKNIYQLNTKIGFSNTNKLVNTIQLLKDDSAELKGSMKNINSNITQRKELQDEYDSLKDDKVLLENELASINSSLNNLPSGVSTGSLEYENIIDQKDHLVDDIELKKEQMNDIETKINDLEDDMAKYLAPNLNDSIFRYSGALSGLVHLNEKISPSVMSEIKNWQKTKLAGLLEERTKIAMAAKFLAYRSEKVFDKELKKSLSN